MSGLFALSNFIVLGAATKLLQWPVSVGWLGHHSDKQQGYWLIL